nr:MAG TPA: hypothetical protein [Caudoviricetes sp.]
MTNDRRIFRQWWGRAVGGMRRLARPAFGRAKRQTREQGHGKPNDAHMKDFSLLCCQTASQSFRCRSESDRGH